MSIRTQLRTSGDKSAWLANIEAKTPLERWIGLVNDCITNKSKKRPQPSREPRSHDQSDGEEGLNKLLREWLGGTKLSVMVVGANGVGKSMIVNCLLEASCIPAEQYNTYVTAGPKSYKSTGYSFSEQQLPKIDEQRPATPSNPTAYQFSTATPSFNVPKANKPSSLQATSPPKPFAATPGSGFTIGLKSQTSYAKSTAYTFNAPDSDREEVMEVVTETKRKKSIHDDSPTLPIAQTETPSPVPKYESTAYVFSDDNDQWELKIDQTFTPDSQFMMSIQWDKEKRAMANILGYHQLPSSSPFKHDDERTFILPQGKFGNRSSQIYVFRHGKVPELLVKFMDEKEVRNSLWELHLVESGKRELQDADQLEVLRQRYRAMLALGPKHKVPLPGIRTPEDFTLPHDILHLLGKNFRFKGEGLDLNVDRIYVREKVKEVVAWYGHLLSKLVVKLPCAFLEGNRELIEVSGLHFYDTKALKGLDPNLMLLVVDKRGVVPLSNFLVRSGFARKLVKDSEQHKALCVEVCERSGIFTPSQLLHYKSREQFILWQEKLVLQFKQLLKEAATYEYMTSDMDTDNTPAQFPDTIIDNIARTAASPLPIQPLLYSSLKLMKNAPANLQGICTFYEVLSATNIPAIQSALQNMLLSRCAEPLRNINKSWMMACKDAMNGLQRQVMAGLERTERTVTTPTPAPTPTTAPQLAQQRVKDHGTPMEKFVTSLQDRFKKWKHDLAEGAKTIDNVLQYKAKECAKRSGREWLDFKDKFMQTNEACRLLLNPKYQGECLGADIGQLVCGPLLEEAPACWKKMVAERIPERIEEMLRFSSTVLGECIALVENPSSTPEQKMKFNKLLEFCKEAHERTVTRFEEFKKQLVFQDTTGLVKGACIEALQSKVLSKSIAINGVKNYQELVAEALPEVPKEAAKNIQQKFSQLLGVGIEQLDVMEKDLDRAIRSILFVLKTKGLGAQFAASAASTMTNNVPVFSARSPSFSFQPTANTEKDLVDDLMEISFTDRPKASTTQDAGLFSRAKPTKENSQDPWIFIGDSRLGQATHANQLAKLFSSESSEAIPTQPAPQLASSPSALSLLQSTTPPTPSDNTRFQTQLVSAGLKITETKQDGNSQFRALAHQIYGTEEAHSIVRLLVASEILANPTNYEKYVNSRGLSIQEYVSKITTDSESGDHLTLCAFANFYGMDVLVYSPLFPHPLLVQSKNKHTADIVFCVAFISNNQYHSLLPQNSAPTAFVTKPAVTLAPEAMEVAAPEQSAPTVVRVHRHRARTSDGFKTTFAPSLAELCVNKIVKSMEVMPQLHTRLPEELLQRIIIQLIKEGKVNEPALERLLGNGISTLSLEHCKQINDVACLELSHRCPNLRRLSLAGCSNITSDGIMHIAMRCRSIEFISLDGCVQVGPNAIQELIKRCPNLRCLSLEGNKLTDAAVAELLEAPQLHSLSLKDCNLLTDAAFTASDSKCNISSLDLSEVSRLTDQTLAIISVRFPHLQGLRLSSKHVTDAGVAMLANKCADLRLLDLSGCEAITDMSVKALAQCCPNLETLSLAFCKNITNAVWTEAASHPTAFRSLMSLNLTRCVALTDEVLMSIAQLAPAVRSLNLANCEDFTDAGLMHLVGKMEQLQDLNLSKCLKITDNGVCALIKSPGRFRLQKLNLFGCKVTDNTVDTVVQHCPHLLELDLSSCEGVTDLALSRLAERCHEIESLSLEECKITNEGIAQLALKCRTLNTIKLAYCKTLSDAALESLANGCPQLKFLDISYCNSMTIRGVRRALHKWRHLTTLHVRGHAALSTEGLDHPYLQDLNISWCKGAEDQALLHIARGCPRLTKLDLAWCSKITGTAVHKVAAACSSLKSINLRGCTRVSFLTIKFLSGANLIIYN